jgi:hypothetical protein
MDPRLRQVIEESLLPALRLASPNPHDPIEVRALPAPWELVGTGNYAAVLAHPDWPEWVVKVYGPGRPGLADEIKVYARLGEHPGFGRLIGQGEGYLVLKRLRGVNLYECLRRGVPIPPQAIQDVDEALAWARQRGLHPHDVHGKNVILQEGRGIVADVSDFLEPTEDKKWAHLRKAYYRFYRPFWSKLGLPVPGWVLWLIRKAYRAFASSD